MPKLSENRARVNQLPQQVNCVLRVLSNRSQEGGLPKHPKIRVKIEPGKEPLQERARSFQITAEEAKSDLGVVTCTFFINYVPTKILFDTGANKSFVSYELIRHPMFILSKLPKPLEVEVG